MTRYFSHKRLKSV